MKISIDDKELLSLTEVQKKVIKHDINEDGFEADIKRRVSYVVNHKYECCLERLKNEWMPKLQKRLKSVPTDPDELCNLIFSQPDYEGKKERGD